MPLTLDRLTFVYQDDPGHLGPMIEAERRVVRFGAEGSGMIELESLVSGEATPQETRIPVRMAEASTLSGPLAELLANEPLPCLVGHAAATAVVLLGADSVARCSANPADLRGKVRFALARVGWKLR
ncbi:MAG: hypothetical protein R3B40_23260 [Polyangiales bacterium]|nr:hypothetical protein [Myxococcales bacterium]MCB9661459.1 hypothetical protein [Sandaracinaceae bacterium]